jgi:LacI family transcriptional regulator
MLDERVSSNEDSLITHKSVSQYIEKNGPPAAIYNVSGANLGIGKALDEQNLLSGVVFIGHELNVNSKQLLRIGAMDVTIGHNMDAEISLAVDALRQARSGKVPQNAIVESQIYTRYNIPEL